MTALDRTQQADAVSTTVDISPTSERQAARWVQTDRGPVYVVERVIVERTVARPSAWSTLTPEARFLTTGAAAFAVFVLLALFALAGDGSGATALAVGIMLGVGATILTVSWLILRDWR